MEISVFDCKTHHEYLGRKLDPRYSPRGSKQRLAAHLRVQPALLSQILSGKHALSLEQADQVSVFLDHNSEVAEFFLLLVSRDRAGSAGLKARYEKQMQQILRKRQELVERLGRKSEITPEAKGIYYSSWLYIAVHVACSIPRLNTRRALAAHFAHPADRIGKVLDFLVESHLLRAEGEQYFWTENWIRLDRGSPHIHQHHANWRQQAIQDLDREEEGDLHYSGVYSIDRKTALHIKEELLELIKRQQPLISAANEEDVFVLNADLFRLVKA